MSSFDVRVFAIRRRPDRKTSEVRWRVAGRDRSRSFMSRVLADSYRAELVRAARNGLAFTPATGEPESRAAPEPVTWCQYAEMRRPHLAPHSRASLADTLATVTPLLTQETGCKPPTQILRAALYEAYLHCTDGQDDTISQRIEDALDPSASVTPSSQCGESERLYTPSAPPQTLSAIRTRTGSMSCA